MLVRKALQGAVQPLGQSRTGDADVGQYLPVGHPLQGGLRGLPHLIEEFVFLAEIGDQFVLGVQFPLQRTDTRAQRIIDVTRIEEFLSQRFLLCRQVATRPVHPAVLLQRHASAQHSQQKTTCNTTNHPSATAHHISSYACKSFEPITAVASLH